MRECQEASNPGGIDSHEVRAKTSRKDAQGEPQDERLYGISCTQPSAVINVVANTGRPDAKPVLYLPPPRQCPPITAHSISLCEVACRQAHGDKVSTANPALRIWHCNGDMPAYSATHHLMEWCLPQEGGLSPMGASS